MNDVAERPDTAKLMESVILNGDISKLTPAERVQYYKAVCDSVGLNPLTQPLAYIVLNGKSVLYATKNATDQLRAIHNVSVVPGSTLTKKIDDVYIVTVDMRDGNGRMDSATGAVNVKGLSGDALANAVMKCETKAKRRCTLSLCGLGILDETELETIPTEAKRAPQMMEYREAGADVPNFPPESLYVGGVQAEASHFEEPEHDEAGEIAYREHGEAIGAAGTLKACYKSLKEAEKDARLSMAQKKLLAEQYRRRMSAEGWRWPEK